MGDVEGPRIERVRGRARSYFTDVNPAHDWFHVERVYALSKSIAEAEDADCETVKLAALLHDIGRKKEDAGEIENHAKWGAETAADILEEEKYEGSRISAVTHCIRAHRYSTDPEPRTIEAKVLSDADNLDALGAVGIARTFTYGAQRDAPIADPSLPPEADSAPAGETSFNHLHKKILNLKDRMYTDSGMARAQQRHEVVQAYIEQFEAELQGER